MDFRDETRVSQQDGDNRMPRTIVKPGSPPPQSSRRRSQDAHDHKRAKRDRSRSREEPRETTRRRSPGNIKDAQRSEARRDARRDDERGSDYRSAPREREARRHRDSYSRTPPPHSSKADRRPQPRSRSRSVSHRNERRSSRRSPPTRSRSPRRSRKVSYSRSPSPPARSRKALPSQEQSYRGGPEGGAEGDDGEKPIEKEKPNWKPSGLLAADTNRVTVGSGTKGQQDIILKYHEPSEARKPPSSERWVLYVFKGKEADPLTTIPLHTRSCWLLGRETAVADIPVEHPSCSKQHAVFQFRYVVKKDEFGDKKGNVGLYVLDLESANGTMLNGSKVEAARYVECLSGDVVKFGDSEREYVLLLPPKGEKQT